MRKVRVKTSQIMDFMVHQAGGYGSEGFTLKDLQTAEFWVTYLVERRVETKDVDAEGVLGYLSCKAKSHPL